MLGARGSPASAWLTRCPPKIDGRKPTPLQPRLYSRNGMPGMATDDADPAVGVAHRPVPVGSWNGYSGRPPSTRRSDPGTRLAGIDYEIHMDAALPSRS